MRKKYKIDVPILIIFFCRDEQLNKVFESVKKAKPSKLYLYQDGPRKGRMSDIDGIKKCREIVSDENIDWECEVYRFYQDENQGCDPSEFIAQKWMFKKEEYGIVLEDDDVPSQSFYLFCKELLEKYKNDERIHMICGMNNYDINKKTENSYFFTQQGSIWGWASWKRVVDTWDEHYSFLEDVEAMRLIKENSEVDYKHFIKTCKRHKSTGIAHYESINGASMKLHNRILIVPKYNMITNIGVSSESTHSVDNIKKMPKKVQKLFNKKIYEIEFPLKHPKYIMIDKSYDRKYKVGIIKKILQVIEKKIRSFIYR